MLAITIGYAITIAIIEILKKKHPEKWDISK